MGGGSSKQEVKSKNTNADPDAFDNYAGKVSTQGSPSKSARN